jgi:ADP-ribose pyrophosphatase YjhB (NUDIX family)
MGAVTQLAYRAQRVLWRLLKPRTRGVKVMLFNGRDEILLVRNTYGDREAFVLPGGGVRPWESPTQAAHREIHEELGCRPASLTLVSTHLACAEGKRDTVYLFEGKFAGTPRLDPIEIAEAGYFALHALPAAVSPATMRRIRERGGDTAPDPLW